MNVVHQQILDPSLWLASISTGLQHLSKQEAVGDGRLRPGDTSWRTRRNAVFDSIHSFFYVKT